MTPFQILTPVIYWLLTGFWLYILVFLVRRLRQTHFEKSLLNILLSILTIDALRSLFENLYFGVWSASKSGFLPPNVFDALSRPEIVFLPKIITFIATLLIIIVLLYRWFPAEKQDRESQENLIEQRTRALRESEEQFRMICENAPVLINSFDESGRCTLWNKQCNETFGWTSDEIKAKPDALSLFYPDPVVRDEMITTITSEPDEEFRECHPVSKDGRKLTTIWANFRLPSGSVFSLGHDITERKQREEALRASEEINRVTFEQAAIGISHVGIDGKFLRVNDKLCDIVGYTRDELMKLSFQEITHRDDLDLDLTQFNQVLTREIEEYSMEKRYIRKDRSTAWINLTVSLVRSATGTPLHFISIVEDISEKKRTAEGLKKNETRFQNVIETAMDGFCRTDGSGHFLEVNRAYCQMIGYSQEELLLLSISDVEAPESSRDTATHLQNIINQSHARFESRHRGKDGRIIDVEVCAQIDQEAEGGTIFFIRDITERKQTEKALQRANAQLEARVQERTSELNIRKDEAETLNRAMINVLGDLKETNLGLKQAETMLRTTNKELEAFSYSVSHDLRAPLRAVDGFVRILLEDYGDRLDDEGKRVCAVISDSAHDMGRLIDDLLAFSRIGRAAMKMQSVDMEELARIIFLEQTSPEDRLRIELRVHPLPHAMGDPALIRHVWTNLLGNAVKFSSKEKKAVIELNAETRGDEIVYSIRDNGAGFNMQYADKLFGVFQRLHTKEEYEGTGIGLSIVQRIINRHGGRIWAEGQPDEGAIFYFTLKKETLHE